MVNDEPRIVLDTNILVSALLYDGKPRQLVSQIVKYKSKIFTSVKLIAELSEVLRKKFKFSEEKVKEVENQMIDKSTIVYPLKFLNIVRDIDDNRVLEAAIEGKCDYIITGDKDLLVLKKYKKIKIITATEALELIK